jgi:DNA-binding NarL/FixJ family response regulator
MSSLRVTLKDHEGWTVCGEAPNGQQAVLMASQLKPDMVILDWSMPMLSGLDAAAEILRIAPGMPILIFTLHKIPQIELEANRIGVKQVISKADGAAALVAAIEELLGRANGPIVATENIGPLAVPTDTPAPLVTVALSPAAPNPPSAAEDMPIVAIAAAGSEAGEAPIAVSAEPVLLPSDVPPAGVPLEPEAQ